MYRLTTKDRRSQILMLIKGLLIGLPIETRHGEMRLFGDKELRLCYVLYDEEGHSHPVNAGISDFGLYERLIDEMQELGTWERFCANVALNEVTERNPLITTGLIK